MGLMVTDEILGTFVPIVLYWVYSGLYMLLGGLENYRLHSKKDEDVKNLVSKSQVVKGVLLQQAVQAVVATLLYAVHIVLGLVIDYSGLIYVFIGAELRMRMLMSIFCGQVTGSDAVSAVNQHPSLFVIARQFLIAMVVLDTWQYFMHRYMHQNKFLYRHIHSQHHRLIVPYAFGALYNHPLEGLILDTVGGALSFLLSGMSPRVSIYFFSFATLKTVDDHCGLWLPGNPFHAIFRNNSAYHDVHHQLYGTKYNYSQPFFVTWDRILGTYMPYTLEKRADGGFEARPSKELKVN